LVIVVLVVGVYQEEDFVALAESGEEGDGVLVECMVGHIDVLRRVPQNGLKRKIL
jgi:hypothetical protein